MSKYQNYKNFLEPLFLVTVTEKEFYETNTISFECQTCKTVNTLSAASFGNKKCKIPIEQFCTECKSQRDIATQRENFKKEIKEKCGHMVLDVNFSTREVTYQCFTCERENHTFTNNLLKSNYPGICGKCQNNKNKLDFSEIEKIVSEKGMNLLTKPEEYTNNKQKLKMICKCGSPYEAVLIDIKRGKHCQDCKVEKCKQTCIERYGVDNVSKISK